MRIHLYAGRYSAWIMWLIGIPVAIAAAFLALFFFTLFMVLFGLVVVAFGLRLWWLRRKREQEFASSVIEGEYIVVKKNKSVRKRSQLPE